MFNSKGNSMRTSVRLVGLLAALALVAAACPDRDPEPAVEEPPAEEQPQDLTGDPEESPLAAISTTRITYLATVEGMDDEEITVNWDPPRMAIVFDNGRIIHTEDETIICVTEGEDGEPECLRLPDEHQAEAVVANFVPFFSTAHAVAEQGELVGAEPADDRTIAGRDATCVVVTAPEGPAEPGAEDEGAPGETAELCADAETGATLYYRAVGADGLEQVLEAIEVGEPDEADFEPIAPVTDVEEPAED
jgi:hypothetical protein